ERSQGAHVGAGGAVMLRGHPCSWNIRRLTSPTCSHLDPPYLAGVLTSPSALPAWHAHISGPPHTRGSRGREAPGKGCGELGSPLNTVRADRRGAPGPRGPCF